MKLKNSLLAIAFAASTLLAVNANAHDPKSQTQDMKGHDMSKMQDQDMKEQSAGSMELHNAMMSGMNMPMKMSGNVDKDFAMMMAMHHQQAIKMADVQIRSGSNAKLKAMARKMKAAQQSEIKQLAPYSK